MDILNSKVLNIEGRLYVNYFEERNFDEDGLEEEFFDEKPAPQREEVRDIKEQSGSFRESVPCPSALYKYVIGSKGQTIKRLREETGARIDIPRGKNDDSNAITVTAKSLEQLDAAITRIQLLIAEKRWKEPFQHFVSIPLTDEAIKTGFQDFKNQILKKYGSDRGISEKLFQNEGKIHLTIGTLVLLDDHECQKAMEVMNKISTSQLCVQNTRRKISVKGIEYMNDDPSMVDVLYARVSCPQAPEFLQNLADYIVDEFTSVGLMKREHEHVKLHATVMNTIRTMERQQGGNQHGPKSPPKRETFDARNVLQDFNDHNFGEFTFSEIHISKRHTTNKNGYYDHLYVANI